MIAIGRGIYTSKDAWGLFVCGGASLLLLLLLLSQLAYAGYYSSRKYKVWSIPARDIVPVDQLEYWFENAELQNTATIEIALDNSDHFFLIQHISQEKTASVVTGDGRSIGVLTQQELHVEVAKRRVSISLAHTKWSGEVCCYLGMVTAQQLMMHTNHEIRQCLKGEHRLIITIDTGMGTSLSVSNVHVISNASVLVEFSGGNWGAVPAVVYQFLQTAGEGLFVLQGEFAMGTAAGFENVLLHFHYALDDSTELWYTLAPEEADKLRDKGLISSETTRPKERELKVVIPKLMIDHPGKVRRIEPRLEESKVKGMQVPGFVLLHWREFM